MVIANFTNSDYVSTTRLWQYDYGQVLRIQGLQLRTATEIHFSLQDIGGTSVTRIGCNKDGVTDVVIPDSMLENKETTQNFHIYAFIYMTDTTAGETIKKIRIPVTARPRPEATGSKDDAELFREVIAVVNHAADEAQSSALRAEEAARQVEDFSKEIEAIQEEVGKVGQQIANDREVVERIVSDFESMAMIPIEQEEIQNLYKERDENV